MATHEIVGWALVAAGALDVVVVRLLVGPRIADERQRAVVVGATTAGGALMMLLGGAFLGGWVPLAE